MRLLLLALLLVSPLCFSKTVVVIQSYHLGYQWDADYIAAIQYGAIVVGTHHTIRDKADNYITPKELMARASTRTRIPIFSFWDIFIGKEQSIGGFTISAHQEGLTAARLASLILNGVKPSQIPKLKSLSGHYVYSESGLKHWNLELSPLIASQANFVE